MDIIYSRYRLPKIKKNNKINLKKYIFIMFIVILTVAYSTAITIINSINPTLELQSKIQARALAESLSNKSCKEAIKDIKYDDLCKIERDEKGNIRMMNLNVITVNNLMSQIAIDIQDSLKNDNNDVIKISLGTISGNKLLAGKGPEIKVKIETIGDIQTSIKSELLSTGINQTLHKIYMNIDFKMAIISPYKDTEESIVTEVLLAEAVIVGDIPETYYNLNGVKTEDTMNMMN